VADRVERLTNLLAALLDTRRPLRMEELVATIPGYPDSRASARRQFERDKDTLRELGVPVRMETPDGTSAELGYRVLREEYCLPSLDLTPDEQAALHVAVAAVPLEGSAAEAALWKVGGGAASQTQAKELVATVPSLPQLAGLFDAYRSRAVVTFGYRGERRQLEIWGLRFRRGYWYAFGHDRDRGGRRTFRVDRMEGELDAGPGEAYEIPADLDPGESLGDEPWRFGDEEVVVARVLVDAPQAAGVLAQVGDDSLRETRPDGSMVVELAVTNEDAFLSFVLGLLDGAEVLHPPDLRAAMVRRLRQLAGAGR